MNSQELYNLLDSIGVEKLKEANGNIRGSCPCGTHADRNPSWGISITEPHPWGCFGCGAKGDLFWLLVHYKKWDYDKAAKLLRINNETQRKSFSSFTENEMFVWRKKEKAGDLIDRTDLYPYFLTKTAVRYLKKRGVLLEVAKRANVLHSKEHNRVLFPWFRGKNLIAVTGRSLDPQEVRFKTLPLFGSKIQQLYLPFGKLKKGKATIVEGEIDCLKVASAGFDNVAGLGHGIIAKTQLRQLIEAPVDEWVCFFDWDKRGRELTQEFMEKLKGKKRVARVAYEKFSTEFPGKKIDPASLTRGTIRYVLENCVEHNCNWPSF